ncbi:MAG: DUF1573 domain-containing protein [Chitinophagaceae bacterium]|nr:DUF1573 domain-containing protein [Chitinophagaceae bacterium]HQV06608.1 DUF1573 domain-containing protein [Chitinophagaceae bacterium]
MKNWVLFLLLTTAFLACRDTDKKAVNNNAADSSLQSERAKLMADTANYTELKWLDSTYMDLGNVTDGAQVQVSYRFKNIGNKPLVIADVTPSCGCTVPEKPQQPFAPGEEGVIKATFDSKGRIGENRKHITVDANTKPSRIHNLEFSVTVKEKL